jgi:hypothetical protein
MLSRYPHARVVVDAGGLGGAYVRQMQELGVPAEAAVKSERRAAIEMLRGDILSGTVKVDPRRCRELIDEWQVLQWNEDRSNFDERFADHMTDAAIYAHRTIRPLYSPEEERKPDPDADARAYKLEVIRRQKEAERRRRRHGRSFTMH